MPPGPWPPGLSPAAPERVEVPLGRVLARRAKAGEAISRSNAPGQGGACPGPRRAPRDGIFRVSYGIAPPLPAGFAAPTLTRIEASQ